MKYYIKALFGIRKAQITPFWQIRSDHSVTGLLLREWTSGTKSAISPRFLDLMSFFLTKYKAESITISPFRIRYNLYRIVMSTFIGIEA